MEDARSHPKELQQEVMRVLRDADERETDPVELYRRCVSLKKNARPSDALFPRH